MGGDTKLVQIDAPVLLGRDAIHVGKAYGVRWSPSLETRASASMVMTRGDPPADRSTAIRRCSGTR